MKEDRLCFPISLKDTPLTRRGILATLSSIFDPLGIISPFLLKGKKILQDVVCDGKSWDDPLSEEQRRSWITWRSSLEKLSEVTVARCYSDLSKSSVKATLHCFSDASEIGYGQVSYLQVVDGSNVSVSQVIAKSRVSPTKPVTIPRLELAATTVSARVYTMLREELKMKDLDVVFWTDSKIVLGYIQNESKRFKIFVGNRVQLIHKHTSKES